MRTTLALSLIISLAPAAARGQVVADDASAADAEIVVIAPRTAGSVGGDIAPDVVLDVDDIASYGASGVGDLLAALEVQTRSGRGRGNGPPVTLVNGRRVSGFSEIRDLPSEAILRVEVLPEDVAIRYGFNADQRVINFILKDNFAATTGEIEHGGPTAGGRSSSEVQATLLRLSKGGRLNLSAQYDRDTGLLESERGIRVEGADLTPFRTLLPGNEALALNGVFSRTLASDVGLTLNVKHDRGETRALFGLPLAGLDPLERDVITRSLGAGLTMDGNFGRWRWTATASHDRASVRTLTDQFTTAARDDARSRLIASSGSYSLNGTVARLPAGPVALNVRAGFDQRRIRAKSLRSGIERRSLIRRKEASVRGSLDIPLTSRRRGVGEALGDLSVNLNGGYRRLSDFSAVTNYGYGLNWSPALGLSLLASIAVEEAAPTPQQLGDPLIVTPSVLVFDFARGQSAFVTQTIGGNPALRAEERRDIKVGLNYTPPKLEALSLSANYFRNRSRDPISPFPALTALTQAAFADRIVRDASGALSLVDVRPVNFLASRADQLRWGVSFSKQFNKGASGNRPRADEGASPTGRRGGGPGRFGGGQGSRWSVSLFHTVKFRDEISIAPGLPVLDLLGGDATGQNGGTPRHAFDLEGGWFHRGLGFRLIGAYQGPTSVRGGDLAQDLRFGSLATLNLRAFINFDQRKKLIERAPILKGTRIALRINNLFDARQHVRDGSGAVPLRYQRGFLDPLGRSVEISLRKIF
jgi:TonB dependent receptor